MQLVAVNNKELHINQQAGQMNAKLIASLYSGNSFQAANASDGHSGDEIIEVDYDEDV